MAIHSPILLGLGALTLILGLFFWRWAGRHSLNFSGAALSTALSAVKSGKMPSVAGDLRARFDQVAAEQSNVGRAKLVGGSVARHFIAKAARLVGLVGLLGGAGMIAVAIFWK